MCCRLPHQRIHIDLDLKGLAKYQAEQGKQLVRCVELKCCKCAITSIASLAIDL